MSHAAGGKSRPLGFLLLVLGLGVRMDSCWDVVAWLLIGAGAATAAIGLWALVRPGRARLSSRGEPGNNAPRPGPGRWRDHLRTALRSFLGIAVSLLCLYFATRGTDWQRVGALLAGARPGWVAALVGVSLVTLYVRAQRWRVLLRPVGDVELYPALAATAIGFGASSVLPFRLGELLRPALLGRRAGVGMSAALSSVVLERLFDMLLVIGCFLGVALAYPIPRAMRQAAWALAVVAALGFVVLLAMQRNRALADRLIGWLLGWLPARAARGLAPVCTAFLNGLAGLADGATVAVVIAYSIYLWGAIALTFMFGFLALDIQVPLVAASLAAVAVVAAFVFLPQAPGFVGTWQAGCVLALSFFAVPKDAAVGYSLFTWVLQMIVNIGTAGVFLAREDVSVSQLVHLAEREAPPAEAG